jgi:hypothetical protein
LGETVPKLFQEDEAAEGVDIVQRIRNQFKRDVCLDFLRFRIRAGIEEAFEATRETVSVGFG